MGKRSVLRCGTAPKRFLEFVRNVCPDENSFPVCHRYFRFSGRLKRPLGGTACKPNSVSSLRMTAIHLGRRSPVGSSNLPGNVRLSALRAGRPKTFPYLVLHREEFAWPYLLPDMPVGSYPTLSPITSRTRLVCSLLHLSSPELTGARTLSGSLPFGVRTFLPNKTVTAAVRLFRLRQPKL